MTTQELDDLEAAMMEAPSLVPSTPPAGFKDGQKLVYCIRPARKKNSPKLVISIHPDVSAECGFEDLDFARVDYDTIRGVGVLVASESDCGTGATTSLHKTGNQGVLRWELPCKGPVASVFGTDADGNFYDLEVIGIKPAKLFFKLPPPPPPPQ